MKLKHFGFALLTVCLTLFVACKSDDAGDKPEVENYVPEAQGTYKGNLNIKLPGDDTGIEALNKITLTGAGQNLVNLELKDFSFGGLDLGAIKIDAVPLSKAPNGMYIGPKTQTIKLLALDLEAVVTVNGGILNKKMDIVLDIEVPDLGLIKVNFVGEKMLSDNESKEAKITAMTFDSKFVIKQPLIEDAFALTIELDKDAQESDLKEVVVTLEISDKATVTPASGTKVDLTKGSVTFTVVAEDGMATNVYTVTTRTNTTFGFEEWAIVNPNSSAKTQYKAPTPLDMWASCNNGIATLITLGTINKFAVTQTADAHTGTSAAKLETLDSKGSLIFGNSIPKVTAGSMFTGFFKLDSKNTLNSTKFGTKFDKKPLVLQGFYKYSIGEVFYRSSGDPKKAHLADIEEGTKDKLAISAILYEYDPAVLASDEALGTRNPHSTYITGNDTYTSDKIVAVAMFVDGNEKSEYTHFEAKFDYKKTYDKTKSYRLAFIASSSAEGNSFSGAPGSTLFIDDIKVVAE